MEEPKQETTPKSIENVELNNESVETPMYPLSLFLIHTLGIVKVNVHVKINVLYERGC